MYTIVLETFGDLDSLVFKEFREPERSVVRAKEAK